MEDRTAGRRGAALMAVAEQAAALHLRLRAMAEDLHRRPELTGACRGVLQELVRNGAPRTVPQLARARSCTRQHVQALVNRLCADGLAELVDNPDHRRSRLVRLTPAGRDVIEGMWAREAALIERLPVRASAAELASAARVLEQVRHAVEGAR
jgi:DNA-binding MarR family transcriptional regulator